MLRIMVGPLLLVMASASSLSSSPPAVERASSFRPTASATATATVTIRVISGVRFGSDYVAEDTSGSRRRTQLTDAAGQLRDAELLEFQ